jgi:hypothetical protein
MLYQWQMPFLPMKLRMLGNTLDLEERHHKLEQANKRLNQRLKHIGQQLAAIVPAEEVTLEFLENGAQSRGIGNNKDHGDVCLETKRGMSKHHILCALVLLVLVAVAAGIVVGTTNTKTKIKQNGEESGTAPKGPTGDPMTTTAVATISPTLQETHIETAIPSSQASTSSTGEKLNLPTSTPTQSSITQPTSPVTPTKEPSTPPESSIPSHQPTLPATTSPATQTPSFLLLHPSHPSTKCQTQCQQLTGIPVAVGGATFHNVIAEYTLNPLASPYGSKVNCWNVSHVKEMSFAFSSLTTFNEPLSFKCRKHAIHV